MPQKRERHLDLGNPMRNAVGFPPCRTTPAAEEVLEELLKAMSQFSGTCWNPVSADGGYDLMLKQCPGACGLVWKLNIKDKNVAAWLVNEINHRRHDPQQ